ncbi:MAG: hypothetical protein H0T45_16515 [Pyrinomonadaceae bacterium]|nr:hypothetical protein [Pyrinomonadaceae bacterium]
MLKRKVILSFIAYAAVAMSACRDRGAEVEQALIRTVKQGAGTVFWMSDLAPFEWERMYVIQPYTAPENINRKLGFEWARASISGIQNTDTIRLLLFVKEKEVVAEVEYKVWNGFFEGDGGTGYSIEEAKFVVEEEEERGEKALIIKRVP